MNTMRKNQERIDKKYFATDGDKFLFYTNGEKIEFIKFSEVYGKSDDMQLVKLYGEFETLPVISWNSIKQADVFKV